MTVSSLEVRLRFTADEELKVGTLALADRDFVFQYEPSFLGLNLAISPFRLPLRPELQVHDGKGRMEIFGVFEDAMPDSWGRRVIDLHFQKNLSRPPAPLERLAYVGECGMGALTFHPPQNATPSAQDVLDLARLAKEAWDFDAHQIEDVLPELRRVAGTSGGARPKVLVGLPTGVDSTARRRGAPSMAPAARPGILPPRVLPGDGELPDGYEHWIIKFNSREDGPDAGPLEYAYAELAAAAGAEVPERRLIETSLGRFFAVRRFDRPTPKERLHLHSAAGLLHADFRTPGEEYQVLFNIAESLTRDYAQKKELFRRVCLNVLACNRDDHLKNFAFLMDRAGAWRLAPLFDFTFHTGPNGWQTLSVAGAGENPGKTHLRKLAEQVDLKKKDAETIIEQVRKAVAGFGMFAQKLKISKSKTLAIMKRLEEIDAQ